MQKIRAHHLESMKQCFHLSRDAWVRLLILGNYVSNPKDSFVDYTFNKTREILSHPEELVEIIAGEEDLFCKPEDGSNCPRRGSGANCPEFNGRTIAGDVFYPGKKTRESVAYWNDNDSAHRHGLEIGQTLTVREIRRIMNF